MSTIMFEVSELGGECGIATPVPTDSPRHMGFSQRIKELNRSTGKIMLRVSPKYVEREEWKALRFALDPDWKMLDRNDEKLEIMCRDEYFRVWESVIFESEMEKKQSWVRHYDGPVLDHPYIGGIYMRDGAGDQKWADGTIYRGQWKNHMPFGDGELWASEEKLNR